MNNDNTPILVYDGIEITIDQITGPITAFGQTLRASPIASQQRLGNLLVELATVGQVSADFGGQIPSQNLRGVIDTFAGFTLGVGVDSALALGGIAFVAPLAGPLTTFLIGAGVGATIAVPLATAIIGGTIAVAIVALGAPITDFLFDNILSPFLDLVLGIFDNFISEFGPINILTDLFASLSGLIDPLVIDLDGDGVNTTSVTVSGVTFDLDNNGTEEGVGWFEAEDGILVQDWKGGGLDENGNPIGDGEAQDRSELFATFDELSRHDLNGDGILDALDVGPQATQDTNGDGVINADDVVLPDGLEDVNGDGRGNLFDYYQLAA